MYSMTNPTEPFVEDVAVRYSIDSAASRFTVQAFAAGLLSALGHNPVIAILGISGEAAIAEDLQRSTLHMTIDASSLQVTGDMKEKDRREIERIMHEEVLQSGRYPEIAYDCSRISGSKIGEGQYWIALSGMLTLHGVTHALAISTRAAVNGDVLKASGNASLLQSDYDIELVSVAGGALKVKDEVKFSFDIVARRMG